ncbi:MAG: response regulator [Planctomycetota bacterium]|nr:MAG: response regulator [Planctomycetota bacterium]
MPHAEDTILILVSHPTVGEVLRFRLELLGYQPIVVASEEEVEQAVTRSVPHLMMIDLDVANCDSLQLIERLSSDEVLSLVPILCMSAEGDMDRAERAFRAGAREYLLIPFDPVVMEQKVERMLTLFHERTSSQKKTKKAALADA